MKIYWFFVGTEKMKNIKFPYSTNDVREKIYFFGLECKGEVTLELRAVRDVMYASEFKKEEKIKDVLNTEVTVNTVNKFQLNVINDQELPNPTIKPVADEISFILQCFGMLECRQIVRQFRIRGYDVYKKDINSILHKHKKIFRIFRTEGVTPIWRSVQSERNSFDEVVDFAARNGAHINESFGLEKGIDGSRCACTLIWFDNVGQVTGSSMKLLRLQALIYAAHDLLRNIGLTRNKLRIESNKLFRDAILRGLRYIRFQPYPGREDKFLEFKGPDEKDGIYEMKAFSAAFKSYAASNVCGMWNTMTLFDSKDYEGKILFGVHNDGTITGIAIKCDSNEIQDKIRDLRTAFRDRLSQYFISNAESFSNDCSNGYLNDFFEVEVLLLRENGKFDEFFFVILEILVKKCEKLIRYNGKFQHRIGEQNSKAELVNIDSKCLMEYIKAIEE